MCVPLSACPVEAFVFGASTEDASLVAFEINRFASESLMDLWHKSRRILASGDAPTDFLIIAAEQQALRVSYARRRFRGFLGFRGSEVLR
jgi:hypothetical protein